MDMRGHIVAEERFLHQGIDHHLFVTDIETVKNEYRFEVIRVPPGGAAAEAVFEKFVDFSKPLSLKPNAIIEQLIALEIAAIKAAVNTDEDLHVHHP